MMCDECRKVTEDCQCVCVVTGHVCVYDRNGICTDQTRDWCNVCNRCTVWDGEVCTGCGAVWGEP